MEEPRSENTTAQTSSGPRLPTPLPRTSRSLVRSMATAGRWTAPRSSLGMGALSCPSRHRVAELGGLLHSGPQDPCN